MSKAFRWGTVYVNCWRKLADGTEENFQIVLDLPVETPQAAQLEATKALNEQVYNAFMRYSSNAHPSKRVAQLSVTVHFAKSQELPFDV
jgi:hypothetical protein